MNFNEDELIKFIFLNLHDVDQARTQTKLSCLP